MKKLIITTIFFLSIIIVDAQEDLSRKEKMESIRIAFITEKLDLSPEESEKFWPIFNSYQNEKKEIWKERPHSKTDFETMTDVEINNMIDHQINMEQKSLDLKKKYISKFRSVLSIEKVAKLLHAEKSFRKEVLKRLKQRRK